ncbi:MAG TPA: glutamate-5-semialdehyde dehydrogenase [Clostridiaceae bacterium]|nr:glutamate-5-semialdehyde dehydrogenase [Clostridiaceae bacterium]
MNISEVTSQSRYASIDQAVLTNQEKNHILAAVRDALIANKETIFQANQRDLEEAKATNLAAPLLGRLTFDEDKLSTVCAGIDQLIELDDPVGETLLATELAEGLNLYRVSCPIGVIGVIFESRPDALVQISTLCLKSGNAVLLKGGSEAKYTNRALTDIIRSASVEAGGPEGWIYLLESHADVNALLACDKDVDLLIPRGSNEFVQYIMANTQIPVLGHADGVCHTYIDDEVDFEMAIDVAIDAKTQYVSVCNATETILVNKTLPKEFVTSLIERLKEAGVTIYGDAALAATYQLEPVKEWHHEYLDMAVSVGYIDDLESAIRHINTYGSGHTDAILTSNEDKARTFMARVDSGNVYWNCSTRFSDGFRYGFGAEVGVSTSKIHARGPVGLAGLSTYKYKLVGSGSTVAPFAEGKRAFTHKSLAEDCPL